jgi:hypothetical protein
LNTGRGEARAQGGENLAMIASSLANAEYRCAVPKRITDHFEENNLPSEAIDLDNIRNSKTLDFIKQANAK